MPGNQTRKKRLPTAAFLNSILENLVDCLLLIDADSRIRKVNKATIDLLGYSESELVNKSFGELLIDSEQFDLVLGLMEGGSLKEFELTFITKFRRRIPMSCSVSAVYNSRGEMDSVVCIAKDITERIQADLALRESEERFRSLFENIPIGVYRIAPDGKILNANSTLLRMIGYEGATELISLDFDKIAMESGYSREEFRAQIDKDGEVRGLEGVWRTKDGTFLYIRENSKVVRDAKGTPIYYEGTVEDITERKRIEQVKNEFISIVSHELRVPLTAIHGSLGWISENSDALPERIRKMVVIAARSSDRMVRMINDMLDIDKIESGKMLFYVRPFEVMPLIEHTLEANQPYAEQFHVKLVVEKPLPGAKAKGDIDRFVQVLTNLLSNASKYSPPEETVRVAVSREDGFIRVSVCDSGAGIPEKYRSRMFQKFVQIPGTGGRQKGTGLGLSISKAMVEKMGGRIGFFPEQAKGTTFYFDLPEYQEPTRPSL
jgi:PAS domain S-box-containing protein